MLKINSPPPADGAENINLSSPAGPDSPVGCAQTIARQLKREGVELREQRKRTLELTEQATKLYAEGRSLDEVAKLLGVQAGTISRALKRAGVKLRPPVADRWHTSHDD
jgi:DNA-directed RNA polymerase specialized sigma subunit